MSLFELGILLAIAGIAGCTAQALSGSSGGGCLGSIAVGFIGSLIGVWLARTFGLPLLFTVAVGGRSFPIVWAILGGSLFVAVINMMTARPRV